MVNPAPPRQTPAPTEIKLYYHTPYSSHLQNLKLREWTNGSDMGTVLRWSDDAPVSVKTMLDALIALEKVLFSADSAFDIAFLYTFASPDQPGVLRRVYAPAVVGVTAVSGWNEAVQLNLNGKDTEGNPVRLSLLDVDVGNDFSKRYLADIDAAVTDIWAAFALDTNGWQSQAGHKPDALVSQTANINERLRRQYRLT
jgi:hypothetical protein